MKNLLKLIALTIIIVSVFLIVNTLKLDSKQVASDKLNTVQFSNDIFQNLSNAIKYKTISYNEDAIPDSTAFLGFHKFLRKTFPLIHSKLSLEKINNYSLLYTWPGV